MIQEDYNRNEISKTAQRKISAKEVSDKGSNKSTVYGGGSSRKKKDEK